MRVPALVTLGLLIGMATGHSERTPPQRKPIFRHLWVGWRDTLFLGSPYRPLPYADRINDSTYQLRLGYYSGAERIRITVDSAGRVSAFEFQYGAGTSFDSLRAGYQAGLGVPSRMDSAGHRRVAVWDDGATALELDQWTVAGAEYVSSRLRDLRRAAR